MRVQMCKIPLLLALADSLQFLAASDLGSGDKRPNIVLLVVDDLGIGDIGCFGNTTINTPNIDSLCERGVRLTHHTSSAVLCTPSRAALLTGRYAVRMGLTGVQDSAPVLIYAAGRAGLPENETTLAEVARRNGYRTAAVGKWHLGLNVHTWGDQLHGPLGHGFEYFYGLPHTLVYGFEQEVPFISLKECFQTTELPMILFCLIPLRFFVGRKTYFSVIFMVMSLSWFLLEHFKVSRSDWWQDIGFMEKFCNSFLLENNDVVEKPIKLPSLSKKLVQKSVNFIKNSERDSRPFLLYHSFAHVHTPLDTEDTFRGVSQHGRYGDVLAELDAGVGRILNAIREAGAEDNSLVYFTSDHGGDEPQIGDQGGYNGVFRGGKGNGALEGGMRVPGIIKWPRIVKPNSEIKEATSLLDVFPTVRDIVSENLEEEDTKLSNPLDGESLMGLLRGEHQERRSERTLYHFCDSEIFAMRTQLEEGIYKLIIREPLLNARESCDGGCPCYGPGVRVHQKPLLYKIEDDPTESDPIDTETEDYSRIVSLMRKEYLDFSAESSENNMPSQFSQLLKMMPMPWLQPLLPVE